MSKKGLKEITILCLTPSFVCFTPKFLSIFVYPVKHSFTAACTHWWKCPFFSMNIQHTLNIPQSEPDSFNRMRIISAFLTKFKSLWWLDMYNECYHICTSSKRLYLYLSTWWQTCIIGLPTRILHVQNPYQLMLSLTKTFTINPDGDYNVGCISEHNNLVSSLIFAVLHQPNIPEHVFIWSESPLTMSGFGSCGLTPCWAQVFIRPTTPRLILTDS